MMNRDELYMRRALELASLGAGTAQPNPMVGAVLVHRDRIIGEGYHHAWGMPHAEVIAIRSVVKRKLISDSTLYVTLEPCSHHGKTPPCASLIISKRIPRVVVAMRDPFAEVAGRGIEMLRSAGIDVRVGLMEDQALALNAPFIRQHRDGRPWISLKWAESADGYMDKTRYSATESAVVFSSPYRQRLVHRCRLEHQAILVGYRTALLDNPSLTNRYWGKRQPTRIVLDPQLALPSSLTLLSDGQALSLVLYDPQSSTLEHQTSILNSPTRPQHVRYLPMDYTNGIPREVCRVAQAERIISILVEGGSATLQSFIDTGLYDHIEIERSSQTLGSGVASPAGF